MIDSALDAAHQYIGEMSPYVGDRIREMAGNEPDEADKVVDNLRAILDADTAEGDDDITDNDPVDAALDAISDTDNNDDDETVAAA